MTIKNYKLEAIKRQIPSLIDGLNESRRKILEGSRNVTHEMKVFQFGGKISCDLHYQHGDMSLNQTITRMAQDFPNSNRYPLLKGIGEFGSRHDGGRNFGFSTLYICETK